MRARSGRSARRWAARANEGHRNLCALLFQRGLPPVGALQFAARLGLRACSRFTNICAPSPATAWSSQMRDVLAEHARRTYSGRTPRPDWQWFERIATYDNAKLSHALILSGHWTSQRRDARDRPHFAALAAGGADRGGRPLRADRLPRLLAARRRARALRPAAAGSARHGFRLPRSVCRHRATSIWQSAARRCFEWFLGRNDLGQSLYDPTTGGCRDALLQDHLNQNQGAESSLAFYLSLAELTPRREARRSRSPAHAPPDASSDRRHSAARQRAGPRPSLHPRRSGARRAISSGARWRLSEAEMRGANWRAVDRRIRQPAPGYPRRLAAASSTRVQAPRLQRAPAFRGAPALHRRAFFRRIRARIRRALQSFDRPASGSIRPRRRRTAFHPQPAGHGRGAHFVDRVSQRRHSRGPLHHDR